MTGQPAGAVTSQTSSGVTTITMTVPALGVAAKESLLAALRAASADTSVRAVVLTGTGRVFCAGQDLAEHHEAMAAAGAATALATVRDHYNPAVTELASMPKPVIAAINGSCAGAGLGLALACDLRVAAAGAKFTTAFTAIGLTPDSGLSATLARAVGAARASELVLRAEPFTAEDALAWGLVGTVVPADELAGAVAELAARMAAGPTAAYATAKRAMHHAWGLPLVDVLGAEHDDQVRLGATSDHQRAVASFLAKQRPTFEGR